jgi:hypothetical protein
MSKSGDELQMAEHRLNNIANFRLSTSKTKSVGMCGNEIRRLKIMIEETSMSK